MTKEMGRILQKLVFGMWKVRWNEYIKLEVEHESREGKDKYMRKFQGEGGLEVLLQLNVINFKSLLYLKY